MHGTHYQEWSTTMSTTQPTIQTFLDTLPFLSIPHRKALLQMCRVQVYPASGTRIYDRLSSTWDSYISIYQRNIHIEDSSLRTFVRKTLSSEFRLTPVFAGFLSSVIRSAPYHSMESAKTEREQGILKELQAGMEYRVFGGDYRAIFGEQKFRSYPVFPWLPGNEPLARDLHSRFQVARSKLSNTLLFPKISRKTVGRITAANVEEAVRIAPDNRMAEEDPFTVLQLERLYHRFGWKIGGPAEVRSAWKHGDLKPRIYYAQGGDAFASSKYIQPVFNILLDLFPFVHRQNRHNPPESELESNELLIIYDFSSFTSRLDELSAFLEILSRFFVGTIVQLVDTWEGIVNKDLGELLAEYNDQVCRFAECDITQILDVRGETLVFNHTTGMLGVPGNISACTLLHGIFTAYLTGSITKSKCVGDDAKLYIDKNSEEVARDLQHFGEISKEKAEVWQRGVYDDSETWAYVKRPISRLPLNRVITGHLLTFPTLDTLCNLEDDGFHRFIPDQETPYKRIVRLIRQWNRLLVQLWVLDIDYSSQDRDLLYTFQKTVLFAIRRLSTKLKHPHFECLFRLQPETFGSDPRKIFVESLAYDEELLLPESNPVQPEYYGYEGEEFVGVKTRMLALLEKLGYVRCSLKMSRYRKGQTPDWFLQKILEGDFSLCYDYVVLYDFPMFSSYDKMI